jgi:hypothetical protein
MGRLAVARCSSSSVQRAHSAFYMMHLHKTCSVWMFIRVFSGVISGSAIQPHSLSADNNLQAHNHTAVTAAPRAGVARHSWSG